MVLGTRLLTTTPTNGKFIRTLGVLFSTKSAFLVCQMLGLWDRSCTTQLAHVLSRSILYTANRFWELPTPCFYPVSFGFSITTVFFFLIRLTPPLDPPSETKSSSPSFHSPYLTLTLPKRFLFSPFFNRRHCYDNDFFYYFWNLNSTSSLFVKILPQTTTSNTLKFSGLKQTPQLL